ncbi:MAG TPA: phosphate ABC transporter substrate-binding protein PstS [Thermoplasmata archaeon]|nr:phosphate ABC transporter substrate-binding protein PstS [Thermoplasmata archaeon]
MNRTSVYAIVGIVLVVILLIGAAFALGWFRGPSKTGAGTCPANQQVSGTGASLVTSVLTTWANAYEKSSGNTIQYTASGAGAGVTALTGLTTDFAATDEPLNSSETAALPSPALTFPFVGGSVAVIFNVPGVSTPINLSGAVLADIYLGSIASWNDPAIAALNPGINLPSNGIATVHRLDSAGTTYVLTDYLAHASPTFQSQVGIGLQVAWPNPTTPAKAISGNSKLAAYVGTTKYSIGYVDLADAHSASGVTIAALQNPAGRYIVPTAADTESAIATIAKNTTFPTSASSWGSVDFTNAAGPADYPLAALAYGFVYKAMDKGYQPTLQKSQAIRQWFTYMITTGQSSAAALYYAPLPGSVVAVDQAGLQTLTYGGNPLPACT